MPAKETTRPPDKSDLQRRLDRLLLRQRLRIVLLTVAALGGFAAVFAFITYEQTATIDQVVETRYVSGIITGVRRSYSRRGGYSVSIRLESGRDISAISRLAAIPVRGEHVRVMEIVHASGKKNYAVRQLLPAKHIAPLSSGS